MKSSMIIGFAVLGIIVSIMFFSLGSVILFIDLRSALIVGGVLIGGMLIACGASLPFQALKEALSGTGITDIAKLRRCVSCFNTASQLSIAGGVIGSVSAVIGMLARINDPSTLGANVAISLLTVLYGVILSETIFQPLKHALVEKSAAAAENADSPVSERRWLILGLGVFVSVTPMMIFLISI